MGTLADSPRLAADTMLTDTIPVWAAPDQAAHHRRNVGWNRPIQR